MAAATPVARTKVGHVHINAIASDAEPDYISYEKAHMTTESGAILDADSLRANFIQGANTLKTLWLPGT